MEEDSSSSDSSVEDEEIDDASEESEEIDRDKIRKDVSEMSFEQLIKLKEQMGSKLYNKTVLGAAPANKSKNTFKRLNKNRPREMSSKRPIKIKDSIIPAKKSHVRDPRFDPLCGSYNEKAFKNSYKFLTNIKIKECEELKKQLQDTEDPKEKKRIKFVLQRLENQLREQEKNEKKNEALDVERNEIKEKIRKGEKVHYKTKSERQIEGLVSKYEELKKSNKLQKYIEKKSKKNAKKNSQSLAAS